ncbi:MAG: site-specific integrase [Chloroflexi bacterium]|nr:site-specific integrase [Chloroflexota bacterium]
MANQRGRRGHGEGSIYQAPDGRWVAVVDQGYVDGKRKRKVYYGTTRKEAAERLKTALHDQAAGLPLPSERLTVGQFLDQWLKDSAKPSVRPKTFSSYAQLVRIHLGPALGKILLAKLSPQDVQAFMNQKREAGLSPRTVQYLRAVLRRALGQALKWGLVARNVATLVDPPKSKRTEIQPLDATQATRFLEAVRGDRLEALYAVVLAVGLRQGEALGLRWQDDEGKRLVDLEAGTLTVRHALQRIDGKLQLVEPKTEKSRRTLALPAFAIDALRAHRVRQLEERLAAGSLWQEQGFVFTTSVGTPLDARNVVRYFQAHLARAGLPHKRFHDLRHSCASLLLAQGEQLRDIMELLGHSQISLTADLYAHVLEASKRRTAARMDALLGTRQ